MCSIIQEEPPSSNRGVIIQKTSTSFNGVPEIAPTSPLVATLSPKGAPKAPEGVAEFDWLTASFKAPSLNWMKEMKARLETQRLTLKQGKAKLGYHYGYELLDSETGHSVGLLLFTIDKGDRKSVV